MSHRIWTHALVPVFGATIANSIPIQKDTDHD
jgi:hypothetical protein